MPWLTGVEWGKVLLPHEPLLEIFVRGTIVYLGAFLMLRLILRRESGALGIPDIIVIVFIADAAQNAMAGTYTSVPDGLLLIATLMFWAYMLDFLSFKVPALERWLKPQALPLVKDGRMLRHNMRREFVTEEELQSALRRHGLDDLQAVRAAYVEPDGEISVLARNRRRTSGEHPERKRVE